MGTLSLKSASAALACLVASCATTKPPVTTIVFQPDYITREEPRASGSLQRVVSGSWCSDDGAFSLPIVPFPHGPTEVHDWYEAAGITTGVDMFDANESVVQVVRTRIRADLPQADVLGRIEGTLARLDETLPDQQTRWVEQNGLVHLQHVNSSPGYSGKSDAVYLSLEQAHSSGYGPSESCRVDRHFVGAGYYFQVIAAMLHVEPLSDSCKAAAELASWTVANIKVGKGCGEESGK